MSDAIAKHSKFEAEKKKSGLSEKKLGVLFDLKQHGKSTQHDIAARRGCVLPTLLRYVKDLRRDGYLLRDANPDDFRVAYFSLSKKGESLVSRLLAVLDQ